MTKGAITLPSTLESKVAPRMPPIVPGMAMRRTMLQSTLRCHQCDAPDAAVVKISAICTMALACAGAVPKLSMTVVAVTPNAMPSAPSTSWASNPTKKKSNQDSSTRRPCNSSPAQITTGAIIAVRELSGAALKG